MDKIKFIRTNTFITILVLGSVLSVYGQNSSKIIEWNKAADSSINAMIQDYWNSKYLYFNTDNQEDTLFQYWPQAHALDELVAAYKRTHNKKYLRYIHKWYQGVKQQTGGMFINNYYDDMEWNALAMLRAYQVTHDQKYLRTVNHVWKNIQGGWSIVAGGGIQWQKKSSNSKNACSNGPASILASNLYLTEHKKNDLKWAKKIYNWEKSTLVDSVSGAVWDNISFKGCGVSIKKNWKFTYNQGTFIGAALKLYDITGQKKYLNDAIKTVDFTIHSLTQKGKNILKDEGNGDGGLFKGIFIRYFTKLILCKNLSKKKRDQYVNFLAHNARVLWLKGTNHRNVTFGSNWSRNPGKKVGLKTDLSGVILMQSAALLHNRDIIQ